MIKNDTRENTNKIIFSLIGSMLCESKSYFETENFPLPRITAGRVNKGAFVVFNSTGFPHGVNTCEEYVNIRHVNSTRGIT